ncbi:MAG TPA: M1 family aminopeptidase [Thermoanaerobaculia bacterium]|nr:M1 family aminopeptidase [Thermoanaerobaculia bacterium]
MTLASRFCLSLAVAAFCLAGALAAPLHAAINPATDPTYAALRGAAPDGRRILVHDLVLERDAFRFELQSGALHLLGAVDGRTIGAVFVGQGSYRLSPATLNETRQLALASKSGKGFEVLTDTFEDLLLLFTDDTLAELERHASIQPGSPDPRAVDVEVGWLKRQRKDFRTNFHIRILEDLLNDPGRTDGVFLALVNGRKYPPALAAVDPDGAEALRIYPRLGGEDTLFWVATTDSAGIWYLCDRQEEVERRQPTPEKRLADALDYRIETEIERDADIVGKATVRFVPLVEGLRVLPVYLLPRLRIGDASYAVEAPAEETATEPAWKPLAWIQEDWDEDGDAAVVFPEPLPKRATVRLRLAYKGDEVLQNVGIKTYVVTARESWYPNLGIFSDTAKFELIYRIPANLEVVSVGRKVEERTEGKQRISVWRTDNPIQVAGFNYGKFERHERKDDVSGIEVEVFTGTDRPYLGPEAGTVSASLLADSAAVDGVNSARVYTTYFGPLPDSYVAISQQAQWNFGQSWPSLIFLPYMAFLSGMQRQALGLLGAADFVNRVGFHEFAHQWWGHRVGAATYRDQWLEEGFSEFSAALAVQHTQGWPGYIDFWRDARKFIFGKYPGNAIPHDQAGPITQGWRLSTQISPSAAQAMIYSKGGYVLHMLRTLMWDEKAKLPDAAFIAMMKDFTSTYGGKLATTADFQRVVERHMVPALNAMGDGKMDWFFNQWVYGTDVPRYVSSLKVEKADGGQYRIHGEVRQEGVGKDFRAAVPLAVDFGKDDVVRIGMIRMTGETTAPVDATLKLPKAPKRVLVNAFGEVLARD